MSSGNQKLKKNNVVVNQDWHLEWEQVFNDGQSEWWEILDSDVQYIKEVTENEAHNDRFRNTRFTKKRDSSVSWRGVF